MNVIFIQNQVCGLNNIKQRTFLNVFEAIQFVVTNTSSF